MNTGEISRILTRYSPGRGVLGVVVGGLLVGAIAGIASERPPFFPTVRIAKK